MKAQVTKKEVMNSYSRVITIGYCDAYHLLRYESPRFYTAGVYGWNSDIYVFENGYRTVAISTGYRSFGNINPPYELVREYDKKAGQLLDDISLSYDEKKEKIQRLLSEFIEKSIAGVE